MGVKVAQHPIPPTIHALTPYPGTGFPGGNERRVAVTFSLPGDATPHVLWLPLEGIAEDVVYAAIELWQQQHRSP